MRQSLRGWNACGNLLWACLLAAWGVAAVDLPADYTRLEWIQATGTQYVDTGCFVGEYDRVKSVMWAERNQPSDWAAAFGARTSDTSECYQLDLCAANAEDKAAFGWLRYHRGDPSAASRQESPDFYDHKVELVCDGTRLSYRAAGTAADYTTLDTTKTTGDCRNTFLIFAVGREGNEAAHLSAYKLYAFQIERQDGSLARDYVPCRTARGEAGLWDRVGGRFYGNMGSGTFWGADDGEVYLGYLESSGKQWIDTGFAPTDRTTIRASLNVKTRTNNWSEFFGSVQNDRPDNSVALRYYSNTRNLNALFCNPEYGEAQIAIEDNADYDIVLTAGGLQVTDAAGETRQARISTTRTPWGGNLFVFAGNNNGEVRRHQAMRLYGLQITDGGTAPVRDFVGCRTADGRIGLKDKATGAFYPNNGWGYFAYGGLVYTVDGTQISVREGPLTDRDLDVYASLEKAGPHTVDASALSHVPVPLTVAAGTLSFQDGAAKTYAVNGTLTLKGGATLAVDLTADGADALAAQALDLSGASAANPVEIQVNSSGVAGLPADAAWPVVDRVDAADLDKFALVSSLPLQLAVRDGALMLVSRTEPAAELPAGYARLAWIRSDGRQFIDTNLAASRTLQAEADLALHDTVERVAFGMRVSDRAEWNLLAGADACTFACCNTQVALGAGLARGVRALVRVGTDDNRACYGALLAAAGTLVAQRTEPQAGLLANLSVYLFAVNQANGPFVGAPMSLYGFKMYDFLRDDDRQRTLLRQFVPCRNPDGEPGLYEVVEGRFYGNRGEGHFLGSDEDVNARLGWVASSATQWIDTGYQPSVDVRIEAAFNSLTRSANWAEYFGVMNNDASANAVTLRYRNNTMDLNGLFCNARHDEALLAIQENTDYRVELRKNRFTVGDRSVGITTVNEPYAGNLYLFCGNNGGTARRFQAMRLYSFKAYDTVDGAEALVRDLVPYRAVDGEIGLLDQVDGTFYANRGTGVFTWGGLAFATRDTTLVVYEGALAEDALEGFTAVEKRGWYALEAGEATAYPALALLQGTFSLQDGTSRSYTVANTLTLKGGARLVFDVTAEGCDRLSAGAVELDASATAEKPFVIEVKGTGVAELEAPRTLLSGGALTVADLARFRLTSDLPAQLAVDNGELVLIAKATDVSRWEGAAGDGKWSTPGNWEDEKVPSVGAKILFTGAGGEMQMDLANLSVGSVTFDSGAGAFAHAGEALVVQTAITNASAAVQTFALPATLGVGQPFAVEAAGDVVFTGGVTARTPELVKSGAGTLTLDDSAVNAAQNVVVAAGTLDVTSTTASKDRTDGTGEIRVAAGAQLRLNLEAGQANRTVVEATHGKTVVIAGDGPDGRGAIYNQRNQTPAGDWGAYLSHIRLAGDASLGGGHMGVRGATDSGLTNSWVTGANTLTVNTVLSARYGLTFVDTDFALDKLVNNGFLQFEATITGTITNGVHLADGSKTDLFRTTVGPDVPFLVEDGASVQIRGVDNRSEMKGPLTLGEGASVVFDTTRTITLGDVQINGGKIVKTGGGDLCFGGAVGGTGSIESRAGGLAFADGGHSLAQPVEVTGGWLKFGYGAGTKPPAEPPAVGTLAGDIHFHFGLTTTLGAAYDEIVALAAASNHAVGVYANNEAADLILKGATWDLQTLNLANGGDFGRLVIDEGSQVTVRGELRLGAASNPKNSLLTIKHGGTLELLTDSGWNNIGDWAGNNSTHTLHVDGGTLLAPNKNLTVGAVGHEAYLKISAGEARVKGLDVRRADNGFTDATADAGVILTGGLLEVGDGGFTTTRAQKNGRAHLDFAGGTFRPTADLALPYGLLTAAFGRTPEDAGRHVVDLDGHALDWRTGLMGTSAVTLSGPGAFTSTRDVQGVPEGRWTLQDETARYDLSGAAGFAGGLTLGTNVAATVNIGGEGLVEMGVYKKGDDFADMDAALAYDGPLAYTVNALERLHRFDPSNTSALNHCFYIFRGQFEVPANATYHFAGTYDDYFVFEVDGDEVLNSVGKIGDSWRTVATGSRTLAPGWHDFRIVVYDEAGGQGPGVDGWKGAMALGWTTQAPATPTLAGYYMRFDTSTLRMRLIPGNRRVTTAGLGGVTRLEPGSRLVNRSETGACPIYGTLAGAGALDGDYLLTADGTWRVGGNAYRLTEVVRLGDVADANAFLRSVSKIEAAFTGRPESRLYRVCQAGALTAAEAEEIRVAVQSPAGAGDAASEGWRATVVGGELVLVNPQPRGFTFLVR